MFLILTFFPALPPFLPQTYSKITRFCLVCNYVTRIIEPLASRCAKFRFRPLSREVMQTRLLSIGASEGASVSDEMMDAILTVADGYVLPFPPSLLLFFDKNLRDKRHHVHINPPSLRSLPPALPPNRDMRKAVTTLQSAHQFYGQGATITPDAIREMSGGVPDSVVFGLWDAIRTQAFDNLKAQCEEVDMGGFPTMAVLGRLFELVVDDEGGQEGGVKDSEKAVVVAGVARAEKMIIDGASESLQLLDVCALMMRTFGGRNGGKDGGLKIGGMDETGQEAGTPMVL